MFRRIQENARAKNIFIDFINGYKGHVHCLVSLDDDLSIGKIALLIKGESLHWINQQKSTPTKFEWQDEYIAISVSESMLEKVRQYIRGQGEHHRKKSFADEYEQILKKCGFSNEGLKSG